MRDGACCCRYVTPTHYEADPHVVQALHTILSSGKGVGAPASSLQSVSDFGAGVGQYGKSLLALNPRHRYRGYDGAGNIEEYTDSFLKWFDLSRPLSMPRTDWVMTLEMGEHIPPEHEASVLRNLHAHNCKGLIVSWGQLGQPGHAHVNNHSPQYVVRQIEGLGYRVSDKLTGLMRDGRGPPPPRYMHPAYGVAQLKAVTVFERIKPLDDAECARVPPDCRA